MARESPDARAALRPCARLDHPTHCKRGSYGPSLMALSLPLIAVGGAAVGALVGLLVGLDARSNGWSRQSFLLFVLVGAMLVPPALLTIMRFAGTR